MNDRNRRRDQMVKRRHSQRLTWMHRRISRVNKTVITISAEHRSLPASAYHDKSKETQNSFHSFPFHQVSLCYGAIYPTFHSKESTRLAVTSSAEVTLSPVSTINCAAGWNIYPLMSNKSLATVLAKVVGLWIIIPGIARIISDIIYVLLSVIGLGYAGNPFQVLWIAITHFGICLLYTSPSPRD